MSVFTDSPIPVSATISTEAATIIDKAQLLEPEFDIYDLLYKHGETLRLVSFDGDIRSARTHPILFG
jgi:hypothetical protein